MIAAGRGQVARMGSVKKWSDVESVLKAKSTGFGDKMDM